MSPPGSIYGGTGSYVPGERSNNHVDGSVTKSKYEGKRQIGGLKAAHGYNHGPMKLARSDSATPGVGRSPLIPGEGKRTGCSGPGGS